MSSRLRVAGVLLAVSGVTLGCSGGDASGSSGSSGSADSAGGPSASAAPSPSVSRTPSTSPSPSVRARTRAPRPKPKAKPLAGVTIALDPGHQLGNSRFPAQTNALVPAGGFDKPCNTTGTATNAGVNEATVNFELANAISQQLLGLGARVRLTRTTNSAALWGPCVDERGEFGKRVGAQVLVSLHADGSEAGNRGFHVIAPTVRAPWTTDIAGPSLRLATRLRDALEAGGVPPANYVGNGSGLNVRDDLGTLNLSDVPVAMIEIGNMRNSVDAQRMTSRSGQAQYAAAVVRGLRTFLGR